MTRTDPSGGRRVLQLTAHLTAREFRIRYRTTTLGWLWAVVPPLVRLLVLGLVFTEVLPVDQEDYVASLAVGLLAWTWFSAGVATATRSASDRRELVVQPGLNRQVVPLVSVLTDALDYLAALPVMLAVVVVVTGELPPTALLLLPLLLLQGALMLGIGMACSVADVRMRDTRLGVDLVLAIGFYATPVFYTLQAVPERARELIALNPVSALIGAQRAVLVEGRVPDAGAWLVLAAVCLGVAAAGWAVHRRCSGDFLDSL